MWNYLWQIMNTLLWISKMLKSTKEKNTHAEPKSGVRGRMMNADQCSFNLFLVGV